MWSGSCWFYHLPTSAHFDAVQVDKVLQLHLACEQRIGIIIVGPSGSGKSTLWQVGKMPKKGFWSCCVRLRWEEHEAAVEEPCGYLTCSETTTLYSKQYGG
jgi:predicted ATP-binding protein involved in virulence